MCSAVKPPAHDAAIQQAVDDYLLMERKARAWDELRAWVEDEEPHGDAILDRMDAFVHPAPIDAPAKTP